MVEAANCRQKEKQALKEQTLKANLTEHRQNQKMELVTHRHRLTQLAAGWTELH